MKLGRILILGLILVVPVLAVQAQTTADKEAARARLQAELEAQEREIAAQTERLRQAQQNTATVAGEVALLKSQIAEAETRIKAKKVAIARLTDDITARQGQINVLDSRIKREQNSLGELLRKTREMDRTSLVELALASDNFSGLFHNVDDFSIIQGAIHDSFVNLRGAQDQAAIEKAALEDKQDKELDAKKAIELDQARIAKKEADRKTVLAFNQTVEKANKDILTLQQQKAAQIRAALFALRDTAAIPFGKALEYANAASAKTAVRPAFLLAILKQESNLGENVGSCLLSSLETGDGIGKNTGTAFERVMKAPRDTVPFQSITTALGRDWKATPVSCPIGSAKYYVGRGFGGGMGPAQFIPSTWMLFADRVAVALGSSLADPWNAPDAFMASALYLADLGGVSGSYAGEIRAACKYYGSGGASCSYGNQVMKLAQDIQVNMIDPLQNS